MGIDEQPESLYQPDSWISKVNEIDETTNKKNLSDEE